MSGLSGGMAMSAHSDVLEAKPETPEAKARLLEEIKSRARSAIGCKSYKDAEVLYRKGLELCEGQEKAIIYANLALVERSMGYLHESKKSAQQATELDPTYVKGYWRLGQALAALDETEQALNAMEEAKKLEPANKALVKECEKLKKKLEEEQAKAIEKEEKENAMDVDEPPIVKTIPKPKTTTTAAKPKSSSSTPIKIDDDDDFTPSDHVKGYKVVNGKKTSYFHNELSEKDKALIGDIAPKKLETTPAPTAPAVEGASAWNKAGTWEERDVTSWAKDTLKAALLTTSYTLPDSSPDPGAIATITGVPTLDGHASYATVRGKKRYIYEFCIKLKWTLELADGTECKGNMAFPDVDGTCELGDGYDMVEYSVHADTPQETKPLLDRFVKHGGLRDEICNSIDDWVRMFRATY